MILSNIQRATDEDEKIVAEQLKSKSVNLYGVGARCKYGFPIVCVLNCFDKKGRLDIGFLATPIWLTCPYLNEKIHNFETNGLISSITNTVNADKAMHRMMLDSHADYYFFRKELYRACAKASVLDDVIRFMDKGVGGIADEYGIKCLHLHYAHYLLYPTNVVGLMVSRLLKENVNCEHCICKK